MKLITTAKILIPLFVVILIVPIIVYAQINRKSNAPIKPWVECRKNYRQALKDESKTYINAIKTANTNYRQALKSTKDIDDRPTKREFLQNAKIETKNTKKSALYNIKTNKKALKTQVEICEAKIK